MSYIYSLIFVSLVATVICRPQEALPAPAASPDQAGSSTTPVSIINQTESIDENGNFNYSFETSNGIKVEQSGTFKHVTGLRARANFADENTPDEDDILVQSGSYTYTAPDGTVISLRYTADENGFQPVGDHLPTPPPIPANILRSLQKTENPEPVASQQKEEIIPAAITTQSSLPETTV